jgi:hypothetical protein
MSYLFILFEPDIYDLVFYAHTEYALNIIKSLLSMRLIRVSPKIHQSELQNFQKQLFIQVESSPERL